jgi:hypothetical protein
MGYVKHRRKFSHLLMGMLMLLMAGCAAPPVQEMSDARQAIRAAREAGAAKDSPQQLAAAEALLSQAESSLSSRQFRTAKRYAIDAKTKAVDALGVAQPRTQPPS